MSIIEQLKSEQISTKKAIDLIKNYDPNNDYEIRKKASKLKILIIDKGEGKTIRIPAIPFWLITSLGNMGLKIGKFAAKRSDTIDDETKEYLNVLDDIDLREIFEELKSHGPFELVNVEEEDGDMVKISIL